MNVPDKLLKKWSVLRSPSDAKELADRYDKANEGVKSYPKMFTRVFNTGKCNDDVFKIMAEYYLEREAMIKEFI